MTGFVWRHRSFYLATISVLASIPNWAFSDSHTHSNWRPSRELSCQMGLENSEKQKRNSSKNSFVSYYAGLKLLYATDTLSDYVNSPLLGFAVGLNQTQFKFDQIEIYGGSEFLYANSEKSIPNRVSAGSATNNEVVFEMMELMLLAGANWYAVGSAHQTTSLSLFTELGLGFSHRSFIMRSMTTEETDYSASNSVGARGQLGMKLSYALNPSSLFLRAGALASMAPQYESSPLYYKARRSNVNVNELLWGAFVDFGFEL